MSTQQEAEKTRYTLIISVHHQRRLADIAKQHKLSQAEVIECMLDNLDHGRLSSCFEQRRADKVSKRAKRKNLVAILSKLPVEKLDAIAAQVIDGDMDD